MNILLLASGGPERRDGGGVFLAQFLDVLSAHAIQLARFEIGGRGAPSLIKGTPSVYNVPVRGPVRGLGRLRAVHRGLADCVEWGWVRPGELRKTVRAVVAHEMGFRPDVILCMLNSMELILTVLPIARDLRAPAVTMEWDPPSSMAHVLQLPGFQLRRTLREYERVVRSVAGVGVTSEGMAATYQRRFARSATILRQYVATPASSSRSRSRVDKREWIIHFAGNIHSEREFTTFLKALDLCGWTLHGRPVRLRWLGTEANVRAPGPQRIEFLGWRSHEQAVALAAESDLGYLCYWFDPARADETENCFPSKMISYMGAGLPPFFHGPSLSSPAIFLRRFEAGYICCRQTPEDVLEDLRQALADPAQHQRWREACFQVAETEFSRITFQTRLLELIENGRRNPGRVA